jgi:dUTP pyrophosphatase
MQVKIKRIDKTLPLPEFKTKGACAIDVYARKTITILPHSLGFIPSNIIIEVPEGYVGLLASRSSTPRKKGLHIPHGMGIMDQDFCGDKDEYIMQVYNPSNNLITIQRGERIGQVCFVKIDKPQFIEVETMENKNRGGFGTTGQT